LGRCCGVPGQRLIRRSVDKDEHFRIKTVPYLTYGPRSGCRYGRGHFPVFFLFFFEVRTPGIPTVTQARDWGEVVIFSTQRESQHHKNAAAPSAYAIMPISGQGCSFRPCPSELLRGRLTPSKYLPSVHASKCPGVPMAARGVPWGCVAYSLPELLLSLQSCKRSGTRDGARKTKTESWLSKR
jgi:hypothetical protein